MIRKIVSPRLVLLVRTTSRIQLVTVKHMCRPHPIIAEGVDGDNPEGRGSTVTIIKTLETARLQEVIVRVIQGAAGLQSNPSAYTCIVRVGLHVVDIVYYRVVVLSLFCLDRIHVC